MPYQKEAAGTRHRSCFYICSGVNSRSSRAISKYCRNLKRLWTVRETRFWLLLDIFLLLVCVFESVFSIAASCVLSRELFSDTCFIYTKSLVILQVFKMLVGNIKVANDFNARLSKAVPVQLGRAAAGDSFSNSWAAVSSEDVFQGVVEVARAGHIQVVVFVAVSAVVSGVACLPSDYAKNRSVEGNSFVEELCGNSNLTGICLFSWKYSDFLVVCCSGFCMYGAALTLSLKVEMWSPAFVRACQKAKVAWLNRCLWAHWSSHVSNVIVLAICVIYLRMKFLRVSDLELIFYPFGILFITLFMLFVMMLDMELDNAVLGCSRRLGKSTSVLPVSEPPAKEASPNAAAPSVPRSSKARRFWGQLTSTDYSGFRQRELSILVPLMFTMMPITMGSPISLALLWVIRLVYIVLLLETSDRPATFRELQETGAGYGLVVDAQHLGDAIRAAARGEDYSGPLLLYRASYFRMQDTLAVSYRWQAEAVCLHPRISLNMSQWQRQELERAITESACLYVWIDKLSVPQKLCKMQATLLARMMAVYATSSQTLVLRSAEMPGSRYHQRAWTVQEYCCAQQLRIVTQDPPEQPAGSPGALAAVSADEEEFFQSIREWHRARGTSCRPYWLYGPESMPSRDELKHIASKLALLSERVFCEVPADRVRALYPMFFNTPMEDHRELVELVSRASELMEETGAACDLMRRDKLLIESQYFPLRMSMDVSDVYLIGSEQGSGAQRAWSLT